MKPYKKRILLALGIIVLFVTLYFFVSRFVSLETIKQNKNAMKMFVSERYTFSLTLFFILYIICSALALPVTTLLTLAGGFLFGGIIGGILTIIAATIGATITFLSVRYILGDFIQNRYKKQADWLKQQLQQRGIAYLLAIRLMMLIPFFLVNILSGLLPISLLEFIWTTFLGIIPGSLVYAFAGQELATISSPRDILSPPIIATLILLGFVAILLPKMIERIQKRRSKKLPGE